MLSMFSFFWTTKLGGGISVALLLFGAGKMALSHVKDLNQQIDGLQIGMVIQAEATNREIEQHRESKAAFEEYRTTLVTDLSQAKNDYMHLLGQYQTEYDEAAKISKELSKHDLSQLARSKPGLLSIRFNNATERVFNELEQETRAFAARETHHNTEDTGSQNTLTVTPAPEPPEVIDGPGNGFFFGEQD